MLISGDSCLQLLRSCNDPQSLLRGRQLHLLLLKSGLASSLLHANSLLHMYTRCCVPPPSDARKVFDEMPLRNPFSWNTIIHAYAASGNVADSTSLFASMPQRNAFTYNALLRGLAGSGHLLPARKVFDEMPEKNAAAINAIMAAYVRSGYPSEALSLYRDVNLSYSGCYPTTTGDDNFVLATALNACARRGRAYNCARQIHARLVAGNVRLDAVLSSALIDAYGKCGDPDGALRVFEHVPGQDEFALSALITSLANAGRWEDAMVLLTSHGSGRIYSAALWNCMLSGCISNGRGAEAIGIFQLMWRDGVRADSSTVTSMLGACGMLGATGGGKQLHCLTWRLGLVEDVVVGTALVDFYSNSGLFDEACGVFSGLAYRDTIVLNSMIHVYSSCGRIQDARRVFNGIVDRSLISWNSMIVGYSQNGFATKALGLFLEMHRAGVSMDNVTLATALSACTGICSLRLGEQVFALATVVGFESDHIVSTSLVDLYCKCGRVGEGREIFEEMRKSDHAPWNSMLMGYATNGCGMEVLKLFRDMVEAGIKPNQVTFIAVLTGCCHCGLIEEGRKRFEEMEGYGIRPVMEHYSCMVDLLVRAGRLQEALDFIGRMPLKVDVGIWTSLLRGCVARGDEALGREVAERIIKLDPQQAGHYLQLAGIYAAQGKWEKSEQIRKEMVENVIVRDPGCSWMDA